jgi:predicted MFS family arabinose efflux permease
MATPVRVEPSELRGRARWVVLGCLLCQLGLGFGYAFDPLAPDILAEFGWSRALFSSARAPQLVAMALASPLVGAAAVRFGARPIVAGSVSLLALAFAGMASMQAFWQYYALAVLLGVALTGVGDVAIGAVVAQWVSRARGLALGVVYTGSNLGGMLVTPLAAWVASQHGWRTALLVLACVGLALMLPPALLAVREPPAGFRPLGAGDGPSAASGEPPAADLALREALRTRSFWALGFALFACLFTHLGVTGHLVLFLTDQGMERVEAAGWLATAIGLGVISKVGFGLLADRMHPRSAMLAVTALLAASAALLPWLPERAFLWAFTVGFGFATAARDVTYPLLLASCFGVGHLAAIYGALMVILLPGGILGPVFAGFSHDRLGSYAPAFAAFAALNVLALGGLAFVSDERAGRRVAAPASPASRR